MIGTICAKLIAQLEAAASKPPWFSFCLEIAAPKWRLPSLVMRQRKKAQSITLCAFPGSNSTRLQ